jgi:hypothetical protein
MSIVERIFSAAVKPITDYVTRRAEIKAEDRQQERALKKAMVDRQIELIQQGLTADMNWEMEFARQAASSWKDEYTLIVVSIPAVMAFIPGMDVYVANGFDALQKTPAWYQIMLITLFFATVGIRYWRRSQSDT